MPISKIPGKGTQDLFNNISDAGTEGTKVATGTTAQRGTTTGQWRYNTETGFFEGRNTGGDFSTLEPSPTITSVDVTEVDSQQEVTKHLWLQVLILHLAEQYLLLVHLLVLMLQQQHIIHQLNKQQ